MPPCIHPVAKTRPSRFKARHVDDLSSRRCIDTRPAALPTRTAVHHYGMWPSAKMADSQSQRDARSNLMHDRLGCVQLRVLCGIMRASTGWAHVQVSDGMPPSVRRQPKTGWMATASCGHDVRASSVRVAILFSLAFLILQWRPLVHIPDAYKSPRGAVASPSIHFF